MDGVDGVTQCPIAPGNSFQYVFNTANQAGTFWYHSHFGKYDAFLTNPDDLNAGSGVQYCDGVRGALIIYDPSDPLKSLYDGE